MSELRNKLLRRAIKLLVDVESKRMRGMSAYDVVRWHGRRLPVHHPEPSMCPNCGVNAVVALPALQSDICMSCNWTPVRSGNLPGVSAPPFDRNARQVPARQLPKNHGIPVDVPVVDIIFPLTEGKRMHIQRRVDDVDEAGNAT